MENKKYIIAAIVKNDKLLIFKDKFLSEDNSYILPYEEYGKDITKKFNFSGEELEDMFEYSIDDITFVPKIYYINEDSLGLNNEQWIEVKEFDKVEFNKYFKYAVNYLKKYLVKKYYIISKDVENDINVASETEWEKTCTEIEAYIEFNKALKNDKDICLFDEMGELMKQGN